MSLGMKALKFSAECALEEVTGKSGAEKANGTGSGAMLAADPLLARLS